jgi:prevent-host-death family protein
MWQLAEAKNKFSQIVEMALSEGPQFVSKHGREAVVVVSAADYRRLTGQERSFREYLRAGESFEGVELARDRSAMRDVDL